MREKERHLGRKASGIMLRKGLLETGGSPLPQANSSFRNSWHAEHMDRELRAASMKIKGRKGDSVGPDQ